MPISPDSRSEQQLRIDRRRRVKGSFAQYVIQPVFSKTLMEAALVPAARAASCVRLSIGIPTLPDVGYAAAKTAVVQWRQTLESGTQ